MALSLIGCVALTVVQLPAALEQRLTAAERDQLSVVEGDAGWLFFAPELRALRAGPLWGERATADPVPAIVDFDAQMKRLGIALWVVPIPMKTVVCADRLLDEPPSARLDRDHAALYRELRRRGVEVIDLHDVFARHRGTKLYCRTDSHWTSAGAGVAARHLADRVAELDWYRPLDRAELRATTRSTEIRGDLSKLLGRDERETVELTVVGDHEREPIPPDRDSPVLVLGDSHALVFHDPTLHAKAAGFPDQLALRLGFAVDLIAVRGSAANATRLSLYRRGDGARGKRLVIWCFSAREFTETAGFRKIPVARRPK